MEERERGKYSQFSFKGNLDNETQESTWDGKSMLEWYRVDKKYVWA